MINPFTQVNPHLEIVAIHQIQESVLLRLAYNLGRSIADRIICQCLKGILPEEG
jgi:hypothetical protein